MSSNEDRDRRRSARHQRLISVSFEYADKTVSCVSMDVSLHGAYLYAANAVRVPPGTCLYVEYRSKDAEESPIRIRARVTRVVTRSSRVCRVPGVAVEFEAFVSPLGPGPLRAFMTRVLGWDIPEDAGAFTLDGPTGSSVFNVPREEPRLRPAGQSALHVHAERLTSERTLPDDSDAAEEMLRKMVTDIERRRVKRVPLHVDVTWYQGGLPHLGTVLNISRRGAFVQTDQPLPSVGSKVSFQFPVTEQPDVFTVRIEGVVRRSWEPSVEALPGFGVRFESVDELGRVGIFQRYLARFDRSAGRGKRRGYHYSRLKLVKG